MALGVAPTSGPLERPAQTPVAHSLSKIDSRPNHFRETSATQAAWTPSIAREAVGSCLHEPLPLEAYVDSDCCGVRHAVSVQVPDTTRSAKISYCASRPPLLASVARGQLMSLSPGGRSYVGY